MRIIIFHYHLNPGGVTRIIESQIEAIKKVIPEQELVVITGDCLNQEFFRKRNIELIINPDLNYLSDTSNLENKYQQIANFLDKLCTANDILHFHNLNLGKNPLVTLAISKLAYKGHLVINHAHDFSEDRPVNQQFLDDVITGTFQENLDKTLYPKLKNYLFITLNSFDGKRLQQHGVESSRCSLLPNPVVFNESKSEGTFKHWKHEICLNLDLDSDKLIVTYPVRVIKRKNIGEFILLAGLLQKEANWIVTQPPKNPVEVELYTQWKEFCTNNNINISWEAGTKVDFEKLIRISDFCISTSIQEGFGMVFMEPWLLETPVIGRNIEMVTSDMIQLGMEFPLLYNELLIDEKSQLHDLTIEEQMKFIQGAIENSEVSKSIYNTNSFISTLLNPIDKTLIDKNKKVILTKFSLNNYGDRLNGVYREIIKHIR